MRDLVRTSTSRPASTPRANYTYSEGSEDGSQCSCQPADCGAKCVPVVLNKNKHGCDSECNGCDPPPENKPENKPDQPKEGPEGEQPPPPKEPPPPPQPLEEQTVQCNDERDFPGHADLVRLQQNQGANHACDSERRPESIGESSASEPPYKLRYNRNVSHFNYDFEISWAKNCTTDVTTQDVKHPLGREGPSCHSLLMKTYSSCEYKCRTPLTIIITSLTCFAGKNNGGVGGSIQAGCLVYRYDGGRG